MRAKPGLRSRPRHAATAPVALTNLVLNQSVNGSDASVPMTNRAKTPAGRGLMAFGSEKRSADVGPARRSCGAATGSPADRLVPRADRMGRAVAFRGCVCSRRAFVRLRRGAVVRQHEIGDARRDLGAEARAVEHAVMADRGLQPMRLASAGMLTHSRCAASVWPTPGNVVVLAFDRHQRNAADFRRIDRLAAMGHLALRQRVADEHGIDGLQIELGGQVHHGEIFVVELAMLLRRIAVALDQMLNRLRCASMWRSRFMLTKPLSCRKPG